MIMPLSVKNQSIESSGLTKDYREAICEYVWNGFEANASEVRISYTLGELDGIDSVVIFDNGSGIDYNDLTNTFGAILTSQKNNLSL
ncbi:MAG: ATP-binding protein, partial [Clostridia bacterium]|nr:ATP-binding protein [Clostridia bacterium]